MFREYFTDIDWVQTMPGIDSCVICQQRSAGTGPEELPVCLPPATVEILFCIRGQITFQRTKGQPVQLGHQQVMLLSCCDGIGSAQVEQPLEGVCLRIDERAASDTLRMLCRLYGDLPMTMQQVGQMMAHWDGLYLLPPLIWSHSMFQSLQGLSPENRAQYCVMKSFELLYLLYMGDIGVENDQSLSKEDRWKRTAEAIQIYLMEHLGEKQTIEDVSRRFHLSATACKACFHTVCKQPIHQWISDKRMEKAAQLLHHTPMSVIEVAQAVGYTGCSQFNAAFKKKFGQTPTQYRNCVRSR